MSFSLSKAQIIGNLGADPEMRYTPNGTAVTNFRVAVNRRRRDQSGNQVDETDWYRVVCFGRLGEFADQYLRKGLRVFVDGRLQIDRFVGQDGQERMQPEIVASDVIMLSPREGGDAPRDRLGDSGDDDIDDLPF
jgi:single-strand DNA-binding protein